MTDARPASNPATPSTFEQAWLVADPIGGWLTEGQGRVLWDEASHVPAGGTIVEIGSHQGRSTVILGLAAQLRGARVVAIDPFVEGSMFGGQRTRGIFETNIAQAGLGDVVDLRAMPSKEARSTWVGTIDLLYIDGKHDYWTVVDDLHWTTHLAPQARVLIHDSFCSVGVTSALIDRVLVRGRLRYLGRESTLAVFDRARAGWPGRRAVLSQMPWFARNVVIKGARRVHATPVLKVLHHDSPVDPY